MSGPCINPFLHPSIKIPKVSVILGEVEVVGAMGWYIRCVEASRSEANWAKACN
jgi:hypothetical protein